MLRAFLIILLSLGIGMGCAKSCQKSESPPQELASGDIAAVVNGQNISATKLSEFHKRSMSQLQQTGRSVKLDVERKMRGNILKKMIDDELLKQKANSLGINVDRFERVEALEKYKTRMGGAQGFEAYLKQSGLTEEQILETIVADLINDRLVEKLGEKTQIDDEEINDYYENNKKLFSMPEMVHARHILLKLDNNDPPEKAEAVLKRAQAILAEANRPGQNFEALAQKYSEGSSQKQNGDLGFFGRGRMVKDFEDAAFNAPLKTAVGPVKTDFGYHIIYVEEKSPARIATVAEAKDRIVESLNRNKHARKLDNIISSLRKGAKIKILDYSISDEEYAQVLKEDSLAEKE